MSTKKITELTNVTSVQDSDLLIVETSAGTRSISKGSIITSTEKSNWNAKQAKIVTGSITLSTGNWSGSGTTYTHTITISGGTTASKIDLQPNSTVLNQLIKDGVSALYIENNSGTFKAYAIGAKPTANLTIQFTRTEVG